MPVTELVFPLYKPDSQSLAELKQKENEIFQSLSGVEGLKAVFRGVVLEDNGVAVDSKNTRSVLVLDWTDPSSFHAFYPNSPNFASFGKMLKPFLDAPVTPELYEAGGQSLSSTFLNVTQIIKLNSTEAAEKAWKRLEESLEESQIEKPSFYHANGIEKDHGVFLGLIVWKRWEEYERIGKCSSFFERIKDLTNNKPLQNITTQLTPLNIA